MENQFYQMYLDELSEIPECTNEEMEALLNSLPNEEAVKRLTEGSLAYVVREAAKYAGNPSCLHIRACSHHTGVRRMSVRAHDASIVHQDCNSAVHL